MNKIIFDIETDGLTSNKIHCLSYAYWDKTEWVIRTATDYEDMAEVMSRENTEYIGHNIVQFDLPAISKILNVNLHTTSKAVDTLAISWYLYPKRLKHGLEYWGNDLGIEKPEIKDWVNLTEEVYVNRCETDVIINLNLWDKMFKDLWEIYQSEDNVYKLIDYLSFKMHCAMLQEKSKWRLDVDLCRANLDELQRDQIEKVEQLRGAMPKPSISVVIKKPTQDEMYNKSGKLSKAGADWSELMFERGFPDIEEIEVIKGYKMPNPNSITQVKDWLFSLGWNPVTFKDVKCKETGGFRKVPQISTQDKELCDSVKDLISKEPAIAILEGLTVLNSRIGILKGFLRDVDEAGYLTARIAGLTNTLRFKHAELVNLPKSKSLYGEYIRSCLIARDGYELLGSDMTALEDKTKLHYLQPLDPIYVFEMMKQDYDPHLDLAVSAGALTREQAQEHKDKTKDHSKVRHIYKTANYLLTYGGGAEKLSKAAGISVKQAKEVKQAYWKRNWAIKKASAMWERKVTSTGTWVLNPVSGLWLSLRNEKDTFSVVNSSTGVWCFDAWIREILNNREQITAQYHDEIILEILKGNRERAEKLVRWAIQEVNTKIKLNIKLDISVQFGDKYSDIH